MSTLTISLLLGVLLPLVAAYPQGPPVNDGNPDLCKDMIPTGHGVSAMTEHRPFEVVVAGNCYKPGVALPVFVRLNETDKSEEYYEGLFIMARQYDNQQINNADNVGTFQVSSDLQTLNCFNKDDSAVGQSTEKKFGCKTFNWTATSGMTNDIIFQATIVRNKERFWKDVKSVTIKYDDNCSPDASTVKCHTMSHDDKDKDDKDKDDKDKDDKDKDDKDKDDKDKADKDKVQFNGSETTRILLYTFVTCVITALIGI